MYKRGVLDFAIAMYVFCVQLLKNDTEIAEIMIVANQNKVPCFLLVSRCTFEDPRDNMGAYLDLRYDVQDVRIILNGTKYVL